METTKYKELAEEHILHTYNRYPIVLERGEGVYVYDTDGNQYLDFAAGIAVSALGHGDPEYKEALKNQIDRIMHVSNLYYNVPMAEAGKKLAEASQMDRVFFTNSGTEAVEGALKAARKFAHESGRYEIVAMEHSFHGRSVGALSVTGTEHYREPFEPLMGGVRFAKYNDLESVKAQITDRTCAVILETVQGEGGIYPAEPDFLAGVRRLCDEEGLLLILDEIQCGMGRTGDFFAWQGYGVKPDIMTCAKALGGGVPVGAFVLTDRVAQASLVPGDHGTTYGGNPFVCAAVSKVFDLFEKYRLIDHVRETAPYFEAKLDAFVETYDCFSARRGRGFMQGLVVTGRPVGSVVTEAMKQGLLVISAGSDVLRLVPPLVTTREQIDEMAEKLEAAVQA